MVHSFEAKTFLIDPVQALWKWLISILAEILQKYVIFRRNNHKSAALNVVDNELEVYRGLSLFLNLYLDKKHFISH